MNVNFLLAEVIENEDQQTYKHVKGPKDGNLENLFSITARTIHTSEIITPIRPTNQNQKQIPVIGEHVLIFEGTDEYGNLDTTRRQWYYFPPYGIQSGINSNPLPGVSNIRTGDINTSDDTPISLGKSFIQKSVSALQPYEGDILFQGRWGSNIRLGSTVTGGDYTKQPTWPGDSSGDPILILSNKHIDKPDKQFHVEQLINEDEPYGSYLWLTSTQSGPGSLLSKPLNSSAEYKSSQLIGTASRIILRAKKDNLILDAKEKVVINTKEFKIGDDEANQPMVHGAVLEDIIRNIIMAVTAPYAGTAGVTVMPTEIQTLMDQLAVLKDLTSTQYYIKKT